MHNSFVVSLNYNWMDQHKDLGQQGETGRRRSASTKREATRKRVWRVRSTWFIKQRRYNAAPTRVISPFLSFAALWKHSSFFSISAPSRGHNKIIVSLSLSTRVLFRFTDSRAIPEIESLSLSLLFILATSSFYIYYYRDLRRWSSIY